MTQSWLLYGATGYTGKLLAEAAVEHGHRPILAGRSAEKLRPLAETLGLDYRAFALDAIPPLDSLGIGAVLHVAGPFVQTALPMQQACLDAGVHYLDITGEMAVFEQTFTLDAQARARGALMVSGVGFDIVPTDCLSAQVAAQMPDAVSLEIAFDALLLAGEIGFTAGTLKSMIAMLPQGSRVRRGGQLLPYDLGAGGKVMGFPDGPRHVMPIPWGDVLTAYHSTGIPNITAYVTLPEWAWHGLRAGGLLMQTALQSAPLRRLLDDAFDRYVAGPSEARRRESRVLIGASAFDAQGRGVSAWIETPEAYEFTRHAALLAVERALANGGAGARTPSQAFGADFAYAVPGVRRVT
jgi:short subunit dehydrogenase-like uncharacterized protein